MRTNLVKNAKEVNTISEAKVDVSLKVIMIW